MREELPPDGNVKFEGIGEFSHDGYIFNPGNLHWRKEDWEKYVIDHI